MIVNVIIGIILGVSLFKMGELAVSIIEKKRFPVKRFLQTLLDEKKPVKKLES